MIRSILIVSFLVTSLLIAGCGAKRVTGPVYLKPTLTYVVGYQVGSDETIFEDPSMKVSLRSVKSLDELESSLLKTLMARQYVILEMELENKLKDENLTYNPALTSFMDNRLGYTKPLEYTGLYEIAQAMDQETVLNNELRGKFYDTNQTVKPEKKVKKYLIFKPLTEGAKKATLIIKEIYRGVEIIALSYPFVITSLPRVVAEPIEAAPVEATPVEAAPVEVEKAAKE